MTTTRPPTRRAAPLLLLAVAALAGCGDDATGPLPVEETVFADALEIDLADFTELEPGGVWIRDDVVGDGDIAISGSDVVVAYQVWSRDGTLLDRSDNFPFTIGATNIYAGFSIGVTGMAVGGVRHLILPADLAAGDQVLVFEVTLNEVDALD